MLRKLTVTFVVVALALLVLGVGTAAATQTAPSKATVVPPAGVSYGTWGNTWWQWALSFPAAENPILADGPVDLSKGQRSDVWFLAGAFPGMDVNRSGQVPAGKRLFFPIANWIWVATEPGETFRQGLAIVKTEIDGTQDMAATIDGVPVAGLNDVESTIYRFASPGPFLLDLPAENLLGLDPGKYRPAASDGVWLMLAPLSAGKHIISFQYSNSWGAAHITYYLTVAAK